MAVPRRPALLTAASASLALVALSTASCGGGPQHLPEITPAVAATVTGIWVLNEQESDDPGQAMGVGRAGAGGAGPAGGVPRGGGRPPTVGGAPGRGGMPGAGVMRPGQGAGRPGGAASVAAAQALRRMAMVVPRRLGLSLSDSAVVVTYPSRDPWILPFGEDVKRKEGEELEVEARAEWKDGFLRVTRKVSGAGSVTETIQPAPDQRRLTVVVAFAPRGRDALEFRLVYQPEGAPGGEPRR